MENMNPILEIKGLKVIYKTGRGDVHAVNGIDLSLNKGETLGLVGETGAGKTTTAHSIMRLLPERTGRIIDGSIMFEGKNLLELTEKEMRDVCGDSISMIFQDPMSALNPVMSVGQQIAESLILHNNKKNKIEIEEEVERMLELVGIPAWRKKEYPHQFSGGMKQRVVIAIALACKPRLLLADEPTTALDVTIQAQVLKMIQDLREQFGMSLILITHDLGIVAETCDKVAVMYAGQIVEYGSVEAIFSKGNHHPYTIGLFGAIPNPYDTKPRLSPIEGLVPDPKHLNEGCKFAPRCPRATEQCYAEDPNPIVIGDHSIKCFFAEDKNNE